MKKLLIAIVIAITPIFINSASANTCISQLKYPNGQVFLNFTRYNSYGMRTACNEANYECNSELRYRQSYGELFGGYCEVQRRGGGGRGNFRCSFDMRTRRDRIIQTFSNHGRNQWQACQNAEQNCLSNLNQRQSRGRNPYARCVRSNGRGGGDNGQMVTRYCRVDRVDIYNRKIQQYNRQATGRRQTGVKRRACNQAMRACESNCWGDQRCIKVN